ncbi:MAG: transcription antitermination protein NusB, partial [Anaerolineales bacterium]|nr:transcription antitermination protein NusB [Anaerolineales bacterium]
MKARTQARAVALQVLYEVDMVNHSPVEAFQARLEETPLVPELQEFARQIIFGVLPLRARLDAVIARYAPEWPLEQISAIDRNILRMAVWEFAVSGQTPIKVAINEA